MPRETSQEPLLMTQEEWLNGMSEDMWGEPIPGCPHCGSLLCEEAGGVEAVDDRPEIGPGEVGLAMKCPDCKTEFFEVYKSLEKRPPETTLARWRATWSRREPSEWLDAVGNEKLPRAVPAAIGWECTRCGEHCVNHGIEIPGLEGAVTLHCHCTAKDPTDRDHRKRVDLQLFAPRGAYRIVHFPCAGGNMENGICSHELVRAT